MNTHRRRLGGLFVAGLIATGILSLTAAPAWAGDGGDAAKSGDSCWLNADTGESRCFVSNDARSDAVAGGSSSFAARATFTLALLYENPSWGGSSLLVTSTSSTFCATGSVNQTVMQAGWDNRISSLSTFNGCTARLYDSSGLVTLLGVYTTTGSLGGSDNRTSSYQIT